MRHSSSTHPQREELSALAEEVGVLSWETDIGLLTNPLIVRQMALVVAIAGLFMAFLLSFIFAMTGDFQDIPMILLISLLAAAGLGVLMLLVSLLFFGNRIRVRFTIDDRGALWETVDPRAVAGSRLAMVAGILGRSPQTAGAGALAAARESEYVEWDEVSAVEVNPRHRMVTLRGGWRPMMMLICLPDNYDRVAGHIGGKVAPSPAVDKPRAKSLLKALLQTALVTLAVTPLFTLSTYPFELDLLLPLILFVFALATVWLIPLFGWVVIGCAALLAVQVTWIGISEFAYLYGSEQVAFFLTYVGLAYLAWLSRRALRGKMLSPLMEP
jgi:hypothetical protein